MLSYQHSFHAGNLADVQKHAILAFVLDYLTQKDKPVSYIESHAGRGLYDLTDEDAQKTGEAAQGILKVSNWFDRKNPYLRALAASRDTHGETAYPGSPLIAQALLRPTDSLHLAELHPGENKALGRVAWARNTKIYEQDGIELALSLAPPTPRRGVLLIDPSWEIKTDYKVIPAAIHNVTRKWNVGIVMLWYPILTDNRHGEMMQGLRDAYPDALNHEVKFPPAREGHGMIGSGMFVINPPWGLAEFTNTLSKRFSKLAARR
ncbi:23S rRNA (adenine(2030)-N(6))-methyltransferase RlmJ [Pelagimonas varians]|uniref:Ribosomal RNA large subunit methyltransferase J n=1 Tax=Pelagimonas varians TaxID=696760 RepID=A0A238KVX0_9RHOB|nr:23S rRNA (adenine(2030)-N(6))-methyltransferase RlmJ [Pelagimonas varians]PYG28043.1 23S rRNA (adenine2030-N6)-methyltransferase [Pelagimonas varians]SMX46945.1 Ribosomal RNA large subunit methyltransferase J [Pelagimonas varians]